MSDKATWQPNQILTHIEEVKQFMGDPPWSCRVVLTDYVQGVLIYHPAGSSSRRHYHTVEDEWWIVTEGELRWEIEGLETVYARQHDIVFVPRGKKHHIVVTGNHPAMRFAIATPDIAHIYAQ